MADDPARLRFLSSSTSRATWVFTVEDHAQSSSFFFDGRNRVDACVRRGRVLNCQLRGLFPGGHTVEIRLPGALLRRSAIVGKEWPARLLLARATVASDIQAAARHRVPAVLIDAADPRELILLAHKHGMRAIVEGATALEWIERGGADGIVGPAIPGDLARRFPDARAVSAPVRPGSLAEFAAALAEPNAIAIPPDALPLVEAIARTHAVRDGAVPTRDQDGVVTRVVFRDGSESVELWINGGSEPRALPADGRILYPPATATAGPARQLAPGGVAAIEGGVAKEPPIKQY